MLTKDLAETVNSTMMVLFAGLNGMDTELIATTLWQPLHDRMAKGGVKGFSLSCKSAQVFF
jgi:hypothetical protein